MESHRSDKSEVKNVSEGDYRNTKAIHTSENLFIFHRYLARKWIFKET